MEHLADTEESASQMVETIMDQMLEKDPPPDKEKDPMGWTGHMNMTRLLAESTAIREIVFE